MEDTFIQYEVNTTKRLAKEKRMVAYDKERDETYITAKSVSSLDILMTPYYLTSGKRTYIPISYLIDSYVGETQEHYKKLDEKIRSWAKEDGFTANQKNEGSLYREVGTVEYIT